VICLYIVAGSVKESGRVRCNLYSFLLFQSVYPRLFISEMCFIFKLRNVPGATAYLTHLPAKDHYKPQIPLQSLPRGDRKRSRQITNQNADAIRLTH
jgi:hypothetical protein